MRVRVLVGHELFFRSCPGLSGVSEQCCVICCYHVLFQDVWKVDT